jgi:hypothetical protein
VTVMDDISVVQGASVSNSRRVSKTYQTIVAEVRRTRDLQLLRMLLDYVWIKLHELAAFFWRLGR